MNKKIFIIIILIVTFIIGFITIPPLVNPLRETKGSIRKSVLSIVPIGTSMSEAIEIAENKDDWGDIETKNTGIQVINGSAYYYHGSLENLIGEKSMKVHLGKYNNPFVTHVNAFFAFDGEGKLIEVFVEKDSDAF